MKIKDRRKRMNEIKPTLHRKCRKGVNTKAKDALKKVLFKPEDGF